jgi:general secretion pathway protein J
MIPAARMTGLTLIELLIAVAVFSVLSALAYSGLNNVLLTASRTQAEAEKLAQLQMAMRFIQRDFDQLINRQIRDQFGDKQPPLESAEPSDEQPIVSFTRAGWSNPARQLRSTLQRVAYDLNEEEERLVRITWPELDGATEETALRMILLEPVTALSFRYMNDQGDWQNTWPPLQQSIGLNQAPLPKAVEFNLTAEPWGRLRRILLLPS